MTKYVLITNIKSPITDDKPTRSITEAQHNNVLHYIEVLYTECHILSIVMLSAIMLSVVMLSVVAPCNVFTFVIN